MKKTLLFLLLLLVSISFAHAQSETSFGLKGGLNIANVGGDADGVESKMGFHAGMFLLAKMSEKFAIQPEIVYSRQGAQIAADDDFKFHYDYLNIPFMFNAYFTENVYFQGGPQVGVLVGAKVTDGDQSENVKDQLNGIDFGIGLGMGFNLKGPLLSVRYNLGLTNTVKESDENFPNRVLQVSLGFKIQ